MNEHYDSETRNPKEPIAPEKSKSKWRWWAVSVLILVSGMVLGSVSSIILARHLILQHQQHPEQIVNHVVKHLDRRLELTDDQRVRIETILQNRIQNLGTIRNETHARISTEIYSARDEIDALLDASQQEKWHKQFQRIKRAFPFLQDDSVK
jgi:hypothetical protein